MRKLLRLYRKDYQALPCISGLALLQPRQD
jgi:hypothetical protein